MNSNYNRDLLKIVLVTGESGAGKNHLARAIAGHRYWRDNGAASGLSGTEPLNSFTNQFAEISLPTLPDSLVESELFGYRKGAFTGAEDDRAGLLGGEAMEVLLDEIGDASPVVQSKLLGILETRLFRPVGGSIHDEKATGARFILATHQDLGKLVREGRFREDLYWRANEFTIKVPPLREQPENIQDLIEYQLQILAPRAMYDADPAVGRPIPTLKPDDLDWARKHAWPGNVRQLRHALVQWLAHEGAVPLRTLVLSSEPRLVDRASKDHLVAHQGIRERLRTAYAAGTAAAPTPGDLIKDSCRELEAEAAAWFAENSVTLEELKTLFPNAKPTSVRSKVSQWRTR